MQNKNTIFKFLFLKVLIMYFSFFIFRICISSPIIVSLFALIVLSEFFLVWMFADLKNNTIFSFFKLIITVLISQVINIFSIYFFTNLTFGFRIIFIILSLFVFLYIIFKTTIIPRLWDLISNSNFVPITILVALICIMVKLLLHVLMTSDYAFLSNMIPITTTAQVVSDIGVSFPLSMHMMNAGNAGGKGLGRVGGSSARSMFPLPGGGAPCNSYQNSLFLKCNRWVSIYSLKDKGLRYQFYPWNPLYHSIAVNDEKTIGNSMTTTETSATVKISDDIIKEKKPNDTRKQYMHQTPIVMNKSFIDQYMAQTEQEKEYTKRHKDILEVAQKELINQHGDKPMTKVETEYSRGVEYAKIKRVDK